MCAKQEPKIAGMCPWHFNNVRQVASRHVMSLVLLYRLVYLVVPDLTCMDKQTKHFATHYRLQTNSNISNIEM